MVAGLVSVSIVAAAVVKVVPDDEDGVSVAAMVAVVVVAVVVLHAEGGEGVNHNMAKCDEHHFQPDNL